MMKVSMSLLLGATMIASSLLATVPQAGESSRIAVINGDRVWQESNIGRVARERIEAGAATWRERLAELNTDVETLTRQRDDQALTLNAVALARINQDIEDKSFQVDSLNDNATRELARLEQRVTLDMNDQLRPLVDGFAAERGIDVVLDSARMQGMLYFDPSNDLTDDFLALVNSRTPVSSR